MAHGYVKGGGICMPHLGKHACHSCATNGPHLHKRVLHQVLPSADLQAMTMRGCVATVIIGMIPCAKYHSQTTAVHDQSACSHCSSDTTLCKAAQ